MSEFAVFVSENAPEFLRRRANGLVHFVAIRERPEAESLTNVAELSFLEKV